MAHINNDQSFDRIERNQGKTYVILGYVFAVLSLFILPSVFGILGIIMGITANQKGSRGMPVIVLSIVLGFSGIIIGTIIKTFFRTFLGVMTVIY